MAAFAQNDSLSASAADTVVRAAPRGIDSIMIVKDTSFFEDTVVSYVAKNLRNRGYIVTVTTIDRAGELPYRGYEVVVLLHAITADRLENQYGVFMGMYPKGQLNTKIIVSTIKGEAWEGEGTGGTRVDGIAGATKPYKPEQVGMRLVSQIVAKMRDKK